VHGKRLTVNFAKARPCDEAQIMRIIDGARRTLRIVAPSSMDELKLRAALGPGRSESIVYCEPVPLADGESLDDAVVPREAVATVAAATEAAATEPAATEALATKVAETKAAVSAASASAEGGNEGSVGAQAFVMSFSSVTAAISAKGVLEILSSHQEHEDAAVSVGTVSFVVNEVLSEEELDALIAAADTAAPATESADNGGAQASADLGEELMEVADEADVASAMSVVNLMDHGHEAAKQMSQQSG